MTPWYVRGTGRCAAGLVGSLVMIVSLIEHFSFAGLLLYVASSGVLLWGICKVDRARV